MGIFIGIDVGGTTSTVCFGDDTGRLIYLSPQFPTRSPEGPTATISDIAGEIVRALGECSRQLRDVKMVTIATPGPATMDGVLLKSPNLVAAEWNRCPIRQLLEIELRKQASEAQDGNVKVDGGELSVRYLGDGQAAALGEYAVRRGDVQIDEATAEKFNIQLATPEKDLDSLFMVAVGTGLGGGEVREGRVVRGSKGRAGHAGHIMLPVDAFRYEHDRTLKVGNACNTLESAVSLTALTHQLSLRLQLDQWKNHPLHAVEGSDKDRAKRLRELAAGDDPLALELFDDQAAALGIGLLAIQYIGDYDDLVIGGGVCDLSESLRQRYLDGVVTAFHDRSLEGFRDFKRISFSHCGDQASVIGALVSAWSDC